MGKFIDESAYPGTCFVCQKPYAKGDPIWWDGPRRACHAGCKGTVITTPSFVFTDRDRRTIFDQLELDNPKAVVLKAFDFSREHEQPVCVGRVQDGGVVALMMISAIPGAEFFPPPPDPNRLEPVGDKPLFEWNGPQLPY